MVDILVFNKIIGEVEMRDYNNLKTMFSLSEADLKLLLINLSDSFAFNAYLFNEKYREDFSYNISSFGVVLLFKRYFHLHGIDDETAKNIIISSPMILLYNPFLSLEIIKKDDIVQGVMLTDGEKKIHYYKLGEGKRSIIDSNELLNIKEDSAVLKRKKIKKRE